MSPREHRNCAELLDAYAAGQRDFSGWSIRDGVLVKERFEGCRFDGVEFREIAAILPVFEKCTLDEAAFGHCLLLGVNFLSSSMRGCRFDTCSMGRGDFFRTTLAGSSLKSCSLEECCFLFADLSDCKIDATTFTGSLFGRTALTISPLLGTDFATSVVALPHRIPAAELTKIQATAYATQMMANGDETQASVIRQVSAGIPSMVDFLERGGIRSDWLVPLRNAIGLAPTERKSSVFISYATEDQAVAEHLAGLFEQAGLDVWFALRSMRGGRKLYDQLMRQVDTHDRLVFVASPAALASPWVQLELRRALAASMGTDAHRVVTVLLAEDALWRVWRLFDPDTGRDLAAELRADRCYVLRDDQDGATLRELVEELKSRTGPVAKAEPSRPSP